MIGIFKKKEKAYKDIEVTAFREMRLQENPIVLDVRTPQELSEGVIPNYKQINLFNTSFKEEIARLDRSKTYLVYCRSGNRSSKASALMAKMGFEYVLNLKGGIKAWNASKARH